MKKVLIALFVILYLFVGIVSTWHSIEFFSIANMSTLAIMLAVAFEVGQAAVLFSMLTDTSQGKKFMPWCLMAILTAVQIIGNTYASYKYMIINSQEEIRYFTESILFFIADPDQHYNNVMISYITGAILPVVALMLTSMVVSFNGSPEKSSKTTKERASNNKKKIYL